MYFLSIMFVHNDALNVEGEMCLKHDINMTLIYS